MSLDVSFSYKHCSWDASNGWIEKKSETLHPGLYLSLRLMKYYNTINSTFLKVNNCRFSYA